MTLFADGFPSRHPVPMMLLLGFRRLRDVDYYRDDPVVLRLLGLRRLPDVATLLLPFFLPAKE